MLKFTRLLLIAPAIQTLPAIYTALRNWLHEQREALTPHSSHGIIMTLAIKLYSDNEDNEAATTIIRATTIASRNRTLSDGVVPIQRSQSNNYLSQAQRGSAVASKIAQNLTIRFRTDKLTGDIGSHAMGMLLNTNKLT